ncbi:TIM barrel protein [Edaphobacter albus]|uniref:TIM barrel protein n=1 Tax=Edaphobacter sp. 4G125 TaxID=2763071 RepID=UPI0016466D87|nr:TIM barrel protein [Edaphobacter sp. 4G125]QNI36560.1 TIM barrel protein [Edaphobacter sp. 4G125]
MANRRTFLKSGLAATVLTATSSLAEQTNTPQQPSPIQRKGRIQQSVSRWCYKELTLDQLCTYGAQIGLKGIDLLDIKDWDVPCRYGLLCTMGYAGGGTIPDALNRTENHAAIEEAFRKNIPLAAKAGVPNVITFSGNRRGMSDEEGARNTIAGLNRLKKIAEDNGVTICLELLNSKRNHKDYMADHTAWGAHVMREVNSPRVKLLYDIYHMQIMEGDLIATIRENIDVLGHFHTGGVPGRNEIDDTQEIYYPALMKALVDLKFSGYVAHEFVPKRDPLTSLRQAVDLCDV